MDDAARIDAHQISVVGKVMNRAHGDPVYDDCRPPGIAVIEDVSRLQKSRLSQGADGTSPTVGTQHERSKALLVQADERLACRVAPDVHVVAGELRVLLFAQVAGIAEE